MALSDEQKQVVRRLTADGLSARRIAEQIGGSCTRNTVIGIWHREKISVPKKHSATIRRPERATPKPRPTTYLLRVSNVQVTRFVRPEPPPLPTDTTPFDASVPLATSNPVSLMDRKPNQCCFPLAKLNDRPPYLFCGAIKENDDKPYCDAHRSRMRRRDAGAAE